MDILTTMITPYNSDGSVDYDTARKYVDWYYENGIDGIFAVCQSSEIFYLSLEERVELNRVVYERAKSLDKNFLVVSSGHVSYTIEEQARELNAIYASGTDALILITNRLDVNNEGDDVFIANAEKLIAQLPKEAKLGLYELLIEQYKAMIKHHGSRRYLIIIPHWRADLDERFVAEFGNHAVNFRKAAIEYGLEYEGLTATATDNSLMSGGSVPASLCYQNKYDIHLNEYGYHFLAHLLYERGQQLKFW